MSSTKPREVPCPNCGTLTPWTSEQKWRPFCSERCKLIDLGLWATEQFRVPGEAADESQLPPPDGDS
ncbi:DNA gyrase inhibitor YacG [Chitinimonas sp.]|uniref:DNA gyrase inhibitor YacG n=1 Tax=Chitinimonas sp. TaxID=1934313 RepID=UPI002F95CAD3